MCVDCFASFLVRLLSSFHLQLNAVKAFGKMPDVRGTLNYLSAAETAEFRAELQAGDAPLHARLASAFRRYERDNLLPAREPPRRSARGKKRQEPEQPEVEAWTATAGPAAADPAAEVALEALQEAFQRYSVAYHSSCFFFFVWLIQIHDHVLQASERQAALQCRRSARLFRMLARVFRDHWDAGKR